MSAAPMLAVKLVTQALDRLGVSYFIGGSIASSSHGQIRATNDADFVVEMRLEQVRPFVQLLGKDFYADEDAIVSAIAKGRSSNVIHLGSMFKVDLFPSQNRRFDRSRFARRTRARIDESSSLEAFVSSPEDTILAKLLWFRDGGSVSERQWRDIRGIIDVQAEQLDRGYLEHWARELEISELMAKALER